MIRLDALAFALLIVLSSAAPAAAGTSNPEARAAVVKIEIDAWIQGRRAGCEGKLLIPRSSAADNDMRRSFGNTDRGFRVLEEVDLQRALYDNGPYTSKRVQDKCRFGNDFKQVAPGEYYALALISAPEGSTEKFGNIARVGAILMRRLTVLPGTKLRVKLED